MNLAGWVERHGRRRPEGPALADGERVHLRWGRFAARTACGATALRGDLGLLPRDRVAIVIDPSAVLDNAARKRQTPTLRYRPRAPGVRRNVPRITCGSNTIVIGAVPGHALALTAAGRPGSVVERAISGGCACVENSQADRYVPDSGLPHGYPTRTEYSVPPLSVIDDETNPLTGSRTQLA